MIQITFYGTIFALAFLITFFIIRIHLKNIKRDPDLAFLAIIYLILGTLIGARIFYVLYYFPIYFFRNPIEIFYFWNGGLSFHGGLLGVLVSGYIFCRKNKLDLLEFSDILVIPIAFFLSMGKIANFFNAELYGTITNLPWCVKFKGIDGCRHPVQIYESIKNLFVFVFLIYLKTKKIKKGVMTLTFIFLYTFLRFFIDFLREYENVYFGLGSGQYLNLAAFLISGYFLLKLK